MEYYDAVKHPKFGFAYGYAVREHDEYASYPAGLGGADFAIAYVNAVEDSVTEGVPMPSISACFNNWRDDRPLRQVTPPEEKAAVIPQQAIAYERAVGYALAAIRFGGEGEAGLWPESFARLFVEIMERTSDPDFSLENAWKSFCEAQRAVTPHRNSGS